MGSPPIEAVRGMDYDDEQGANRAIAFAVGRDAKRSSSPNSPLPVLTR
jgi:hypothetical protein